ncbi:MAG: hypothetical protein KBD65_00510 [Candidatus Moranbacteria bacterium]|nr:hypothetical protein [Candidatus Moranbacteria bacterium]
MPFSPRNLKIKKIYSYKNFFLLPFFFTGIALVVFFSSPDVFAAAGINEEISFQGKVVNDDGTNVANGNYDFVFKLYTVSSAGTAVWTETRTGGNQVAVTDGIFQVNLGSVTTLPGSVDFNTDNIYLGIEFNSDGEMSPRVHFTAAPYAMNAAKVGGLTVTDTTGTLTIPNGKTISFADDFTTSGAFATTLTATATTNVTLPTTGTLATLAGSETFTNKTIGSTGLVFSGATTDITTASNEDLTLTAAGSGDIVLVLDSGTFVNLTGGADGTAALTLAAGDLTLTDGDLIVTAGDANFTLDVADTFNIVKSGADAGDIANITASSVNAIDGLQIGLTATTDSGADSVTGLDLAWTESADADVWTALNLPNTTTTNSTTRAFVIGTGYDTILDTAALDISGAGVISGATGISTTTLTASSAIAANGGITFDASTDTLGAFTLAGTLDAGTNILTNIGNAGTDFVASTGALTLAGVLTADGGISLSASQSLTAVALSYIDLGAITHGTTAVQGLRLPQAASASPSSPSSGEGYLAWDASGNQLIYYTGAAWSTISGGSGYNLIKDEASSLTARTTLAFLGSGVSCADNASQTECTISGGGSSDLQTTYDSDADGSNATISLTTADDSLIFTNPTSAGTDSAFLLQISQQHTTAGVVALDITQSSSGANGLNLTANAIDTETALAVTANALTSGFGLSIASSSAALTGALQSITLSGSNASNTGSLLALDNTGTSNANTSLYIKHYATGTNNLAFRIDDVSGDTTPFVVDGTGAVGIGTTAPTSLFELYGTGAADIVGTLTAPDATYDPIFKFRTGLTPAVMFSMGIDNSDSDKFKIYSGDGLGSGDEFVIDASGVTTIANLNLGATSFDENAGIVSWMDMPVTSSAAVDVIQSYSALIDGNSLLTVYAESDGADGIQDKRIQIGEGGAGSTGPTLLALDVKSDTSDPAGFEGAMYYNTFDNVFRCYQNSGWTNCIGSGGSSDLQATYGTDADGSNATISLTAADDGLVFTNPTSGGNNLSAFLLSLTQQHTTDAIVVLDMVQSSNAANGVNLTANAIDGETGLAITANGLTSGKGISITSSATAFTGNLADISLTGSNAANTGNVLAVSNTGTANANTALFVDHRATGTGNLALRVNDESGDTTPFIIDGNGRVGIGTASISGSASTERLLQVGSETTRGNSATYGEVISKGLNRHTALTGIKDVYVYDTTGDSDGGRWIDWATTDNLSWYSETLDDGPNDPCNIASDDRCYNNAFPRKAILVVTTSALYIFDAATNDMWMKFDQNASVYALGADTNNDPSSVTALNGVIYVGANGSSAGGLYAIDFVNDRMWNYNGTNRAAADTGISGRNATVAYDVDPDTKLEISPTGTQAEWERVNDVHAVVMSRTQSAVTALGGATNTNPGYGKVFVALATDSGITVINASARVLNQYSDVTADDYTAVTLTTRGFLYALNTTQDQLERWDTIDTDKASEVNGTYSRKWDETVGTGPALASATFNIIAGAPDNLEVAERASNNLNTEDVIYVGHSLGMAELHEHTTQAFGWVKYYNATRQTPMMMLAGINDMVLPMDDASGTQAQDLAIANTDMAIKGTPTLGVNGVQGKAINFDNTDDYLCSDANQDNACDVDTAFNMSTVGWTLSLWFRHSTTAPASGADTIFEKCVTTTPAKATGCVIAYMTTTGTIVVANDTDATWTRPDEGAQSYNITATSTYAYNDNQWHNLIITRTNVNDVDSWIDGQGMNLSTATGGTTTFDGSQIVSIGASCVLTVTAACGAVVNVWDGQIDDVQFIVGTTTQATMTQLYVRRYFNVERPRASKKTITVENATSASSTSLTDTGESWYVNEFAGQIVEITGSDDTDCVGVTRRISSNTATVLTFTPAVPGACTIDTSADFQVDPEKLYGASSSVAGIGITAETPLGEARQLCVGTNSGSDTGGITCYNHQDGPSIVADVYHSQSSHTDDSGTDWAGTDYDDIRAVDLSSRTLVMASEGHFTSRTEDVRLGQGLEYISNQLYAIRQEIVLDGITAAGSMGSEIGFTGGADLAENYYSDTLLEVGTVVALDRERTSYVNQTLNRYQGDMLGIVATSPGIVLGDPGTNGYPIALVGRVPVKVTNENGQVYAGDRLTSAGRPGFAMRATQSGRVLGEALANAVDWTVCEGEDPADTNALLCTTVLVFVNLTDYTGQSVELAMAERDAAVGADGLSEMAALDSVEQGLGSDTTSIRLATSMPTKQEKILDFLKDLDKRQTEAGQTLSEVFTGRVAASREVITPILYADQIFARSIKADSIEGLQIFTDQISSLEEKYAGLDAAATDSSETAVAVKEQLAIAMQKLSVDTLFVKLDSSVLGKLSVSGALRIGGAAEFGGDTVFIKLASFLDRTIFKGSVSFEKAPIFASDTAGFALIVQDAKRVRVIFDTPYEKQPIVAVSLTREESPLLEGADDDLKKDIALLEEEYVGAVFKENVRYVVTEKSANGFTIVLSEKAERDLQFSWVALSVDKAKSFSSEPEMGDIVPVAAPADATPTETVTPETLPIETLPVEETVEIPIPPDEDVETRASESTDVSETI